ncbi:MAG: hypothetical protein KatS3mg110_2373 [Pirellulaceae bacterium]|nr:MAG: hypothetical protein KatS3mg110_2373 [Pirellulaceae bacterium]
MNCRQFENRIQKLLDERQPLSDRRLRSHARRCGKCRRRWQQYRRLVAAFELTQPDLEPSEDLSDRIVARLGLSDRRPSAKSLPSRRTSTVHIVRLVAIAAGVLVMAGLWFGLQRTERVPPNATVTHEAGHSESFDLVGGSGHVSREADDVVALWDDRSDGADVFSDLTSRMVLSPVSWDRLLTVPVVSSLTAFPKPDDLHSMAGAPADEPPKKIPTLDEIRAGLSPFAHWVEEALAPVAKPWRWWSHGAEDDSRA